MTDQTPVARLQLELSTVERLLVNIIENPGEIKYQRIRRNNPSIQQKLGSSELPFSLLKHAGFEEGCDSLVYSAVTTDDADLVLGLVQATLNEENLKAQELKRCQQLDLLKERVRARSEGPGMDRCREDMLAILDVLKSIQENPDRWRHKELNASTRQALADHDVNMELLQCAGFAKDGNSLTFICSSPEHLKHVIQFVQDILQLCQETNTDLPSEDWGRNESQEECEGLSDEPDSDAFDGNVADLLDKYEKLLEGSYAERCRQDLESIKSILDGIKRSPGRFKNHPLNKSSQKDLEHSQLNSDFLCFAGFARDDQGCLTFKRPEALEAASCLADSLLMAVEPTEQSVPEPQFGERTLRRVLLHTIRFTQNSVAACFRDGQPLEDLVENLKAGRISTDDLPPIRVVEQMDMFWSLDNRRLHCMKQAFPERRYPDKMILVQMESCSRAAIRKEFLNKFTTGTDIVKRCPARAGRVKAKGSARSRP
eukprot:Skav201942  [mRNA]  locus=scaffold2764:79008:80459:- [translate_table: standard]